MLRWLCLSTIFDYQNCLQFPAIMTKGKRPFPFRTRKLSPWVPMVLLGVPSGRVGHRRDFFWIQHGLPCSIIFLVFMDGPGDTRDDPSSKEK
jgi:hypothetical protein